MVASSDLQEFRGEFDVVEAVLYNLNASFSGIIFRPCIAVEVVPLVTSVSCLWKRVKSNNWKGKRRRLLTCY